jgi:8-oxo-dGTP pyrophosphatase MutT (NUDIX family)
MSQLKEVKAGIVFRDGDKYLFVKQRGGKWGVPKGHMDPIDKGNPKNTAIREVREETNIIVKYNGLCLKTKVRGNNLYLLDVKTDSNHIVMPKSLEATDEIEEYGWFTKTYARTKELNAWARHLINNVYYF